MKSFRDIIELWPSRGALADDVGADRFAVQKWYDRDRIPPEYWHALIAAAARRGYDGVTAALLAQIAARGREVA